MKADDFDGRFDRGEDVTAELDLANVRRGIVRVERDHRYQAEDAILAELSARGEPVYPDLDSLTDLPHPPLD